MDKAGRIVIPKELRDSLGLNPDVELDVFLDGAGLRVEPAEWKGRGYMTGEDGFPVLERIEGAVFTEADVLRLRDELQR